MSSPATFEVRDLSAGYGAVPVLHSVSITAPVGTITAVLGANGAGKSTLLRTIDGSIKPSRGQVKLGGANLTRGRPRQVSRAGVSHLPRGPGGVTALVLADSPAA